jgi:uncharacterized protein CbrC (UPF0167 family)
MTDAKSLPSFRYHPDPIDTGSVVPSATVCVVCGVARGFIYTGPTYCPDVVNDVICPWCIADGSAHRRFDAEFIDRLGIGPDPEPVPDAVVEEVAFPTPGFCGWQSEGWWTHCGDAAEFLGPAGYKELTKRWPGVLDAIREVAGMQAGPEWEQLLRAFDRDHGPTAYVFRCRHCGRLGGYHDFT